MKITFLGTSAMKPSKERNTSGLLLTYKGENILVDCGEGIQRQLIKAGISLTKITKILISHWHGDHVIGLPGLFLSLVQNQHKKTLEIYGPPGIKKSILKLISLFSKEFAGLKYKITEINKKGVFLNEKDFSITAEKLSHSTPCLAYSFNEKTRRKINLEYTKKFGLKKDPLLGKLQQGKTIRYKGKKITPKKGTILIPGKKITIIMDTIFNKKYSKIAKDSDLLISESTFLETEQNKAKNYKHLTAKQAAKIAKESNSKQLILTHISSRYKNEKRILAEAKTIFKNTKVARDFLEVKL